MPTDKKAVRRKSPFSVFQGARDAGRLGSRSQRAIDEALGRGNNNNNNKKKKK